MKFIVFISAILFTSTIVLRADDGAASVAAGGLIVFGHETRIVMAKEVLEISADKVKVDYEFRNDSDEDVTTVVAFPIPEYTLGDFDGPPPQRLAFTDFKLTVNSEQVVYKTEARAFWKNKEFTELLNQLKINIATCDFDKKNPESNPCIDKLSLETVKKLRLLKLIDGTTPNWSVRLKYYWDQKFPAHGIVKIHHEYTPVLGSDNSFGYALDADASNETKKEWNKFCVNDKLKAVLNKLSGPDSKDGGDFYVDFILTTANTWKMPIEDFTLIVDRAQIPQAKNSYISFCWDGPVEKLDPDHFRAHLTNFIPTKELRVGFFNVEKVSQ